jgi:hypothetical protein
LQVLRATIDRARVSKLIGPNLIQNVRLSVVSGFQCEKQTEEEKKLL